MRSERVKLLDPVRNIYDIFWKFSNKKEKLQYANKHIAVRKNYNFPYVGIIQIRLWVKAIQLTLSLFTQAPLVLIVHIVSLRCEKVNMYK